VSQTHTQEDEGRILEQDADILEPTERRLPDRGPAASRVTASISYPTPP
jgi:hypothetical protein